MNGNEGQRFIVGSIVGAGFTTFVLWLAEKPMVLCSDAVERGCAEWSVDGDGDTEFRWIHGGEAE